MPHPAGGILRVDAPLPPHMRQSWEFFGFPGEAKDPFCRARSAGMKRFYREAGIMPAAHGFGVTLDGKPVKTPAKRDLVVPTRLWPRRSPRNGTPKRARCGRP